MTAQEYYPKTQADCDHANALREYEAVHKIWFNTPVWANRAAKAKLDDCRERLREAIKAAHPNWSVIMF